MQHIEFQRKDINQLFVVAFLSHLDGVFLLAIGICCCFRDRRTPLQKVQQVLLWFPATIPPPYEPPWNRLSENMKFKKICRGTLIYYSSYSKF